MIRIFVFLVAALALVLSPLTASARPAGCGVRGEMEAGRSMTMPMAPARGDGAKPSRPCCRDGKACAAACGQSSQMAWLRAADAGAPMGRVLARPNATAQPKLVSRPASPDRPPPRTIA